MKNFPIVFILFFTLRTSMVYAQIDITYQRLSIKVNPDTSFIQGETTIYFKPTTSTNAIYIDLNDSLTIISVKYQNSEIPYSRFNHKIKILNDSMFISSRTDSVFISYSGIPINLFNSNSTNFGVHDTVPIFWTQSQPYGCADWWPTQNNLSDKIDSMDIWVTCPSKYRSASNGILVIDSIYNSERLSIWKHRYPIVPYLVGISVTNYIMYYDTSFYQNDTVPIMNFVFPEYETEYRANSFATAIMMNYFNITYGVYPFKNEKYGHAQIPGYGGMENQTITFLSSYSYMLVAHELSHHWFGDYITCSSWRDIWLNEGFATYTSNLLLNYELSPNGFDYWRKYCVNSIISQNNGSVWVSDTSDRSRIFSGRLSYEKGGMLLNMIHHQIGDSLYYLTMKAYLNQPAFSYNFSSTNDFKSVLENISQISFDDFFNYWFFGQGYPDFSVQATNYMINTLKIELNYQNSYLNNPAFYGNLEMLIKNNNSDTIISIYIDDFEKTFFVNLSFEADSIIVNPNYHLITPQKSTPVIKNKNATSVLIYPNPTSNYLSFFCQDKQIKKILIYDIAGRFILGKTIDNPDYHYKFETEVIKKGIYIIEIEFTDSFKFNNIFIKI